MAEEFQAAVCGGTWWMNTTKNMFGGCSPPIADVGTFGWCGTTSTCEESIITSVSNGGGGYNGGVLIDSVPIMGFGLSSSSTSDWSPSSLCGNGSRVENYNHMVQEDWSPGDNISSTTDFLLDQQQIRTGSGNSPGFPPVCSASSILLQSLFQPDDNHHAQPQQQPLFNNQSMSYMSDYNELSSPWSKPFMSGQESNNVSQQFSNNSTAATIVTEARTTNFSPLSQPRISTKFDLEKHNRLTLMTKVNTEEVRDLSSGVKRGSTTSTEPGFKRPRFETPSSLPTFKVRKEKLGDHITALQQLVSPFGKTDTASVLQEAIEYIKFLHDQVNVLSTPYMKQGASIQNQQDKSKDLEGSKQDLRSGGLCLVPISSTFPVANETTVDFWMPTCGGTFR